MFFNYVCKKCNIEITIFQRTYEPVPVKCEKCGETMERAISAPTFKFKGKGFYETDYKEKEKK